MDLHKEQSRVSATQPMAKQPGALHSTKINRIDIRIYPFLFLWSPMFCLLLERYNYSESSWDATWGQRLPNLSYLVIVLIILIIFQYLYIFHSTSVLCCPLRNCPTNTWISGSLLGSSYWLRYHSSVCFQPWLTSLSIIVHQYLQLWITSSIVELT